MLSLVNIVAGYGRKVVVNGFSLLAEKAGEIIALVGPKGSGKSAILRTAMGLLKPFEGTVVFNGQDVTRRWVHERVQDGMGYLIQGGEVFPSMTVQQNIEVAALILPPAERAEAITRALTFVPLPTESLACKARDVASPFLRRQLAPCMVFAQKPTLLLLDEPVADLDAPDAALIYGIIKRYCQETGAIAIIASREAAPIVDRIIELPPQ